MGWRNFGLNVLVRKAGMLILFSKWLASSDAWHLQRLSPDGTETLLDRHLAAFNGWLQAHFMPLSAPSQSHYYLTIVTLLDQLDPKEYNWRLVSVILQGRLPSVLLRKLRDLFGGTTANKEFSWIVSKFLMDRERAGLLWVNSQKYADLARYILKFLRNKWVYNPYTLVHANMNVWILFRRFIDIVDIHTPILLEEGMTHYKACKLAFNLLPILLSRINALGGSQVHEVIVLLRGHPGFYSVKNDLLKFEKFKAAHAVEDFLQM